MMTFIALLMVGTPVLMIFYFAFYKTILYFKKKKTDAPVPEPTFMTAKSPPTHTEESRQRNSAGTEDKDEITAVIAAAINIYFKNK